MAPWISFSDRDPETTVEHATEEEARERALTLLGAYGSAGWGLVGQLRYDAVELTKAGRWLFHEAFRAGVKIDPPARETLTPKTTR